MLANAADQKVLADEPVKLMPMHREMALSPVFPDITLIDGHTDQMGHQIREAVIVVAFNPYHFDMAFRVGELANMGEKLPMLAGKAAKVEIGENISEQHQASIAVGFEHIQRVPGPAQLRPEVDVRQDQRVIESVAHAS